MRVPFIFLFYFWKGEREIEFDWKNLIKREFIIIGERENERVLGCKALIESKCQNVYISKNAPNPTKTAT